jgi:uncharacterized protein DUF4384
MWFCLLAGATLAEVSGAQQEGKKLTARELFYAAVDTPSPPAARKPQKPAAKPKPARHKSAPAQSEEMANRAPSDAPATNEPIRVVQAAYRPTGSRPALGLRYTILKKEGDEQVEAGPDTVFHAGDRIRLTVEANDDGHLYVVNRGSSGTWKLLFPSAEIKDGDNRIQRRVKYEIPSGYTFTFDEQAGEEKLFIVFSRQPENDLEKLIYSLGQGTPANEKPAVEKPKMLLASAAFSDDMIGKLRNAYARDLIVEKVDDEQPGPKKEKAVYAVNPSGSEDSRVVADITLKHQ